MTPEERKECEAKYGDVSAPRGTVFTREKLRQVEQALLDKATNGDFKAIRFILLNKLPALWKAENSVALALQCKDSKSALRLLVKMGSDLKPSDVTPAE